MKFRIIIIFLFCCLTAISQQRKQYELYFDSGKDVLTTSAKNTIDSLFGKVKPEKISSVKIYGYCDSIGDTDYNNKLSIRRAENVKAYIKEKGILNDSIYIKGFGKTNQKYKSVKWDKNRRVSFELYFKKKAETKPTEITQPEFKIKKTEIERFVEKAEVGDKIALKNIVFYGGSSEPLIESYESLENLLNALKKNPTLEICIEGHICCSSNDNDNLSGRRALTVYNYLVEYGIDKERLSYKGFGHTQPLNEELNQAQQQINRRVEIRIVKK